MPKSFGRPAPVRWPAVLTLAIVGWHVFGWTFDVDFIRRPFPPFTGLYPWTAVLLAGMAGVQLALDRLERRVVLRPLLGSVTTLLAVNFLAEDLLGLATTPLDRWLFADDLRGLGGYAPGRPSPQICATVLLFGFAVLLVGRSKDRLGTGSTLATLFGLFFPSWALLGLGLYVLMPHPVGPAPLMGMAFPTAVCSVCLGWGLLARTPNGRAIRRFRQKAGSGLVMRGFLPVALAGPASVAGIAQYLAARGRLNPPLAIALVLLVTVGGVVLLVRFGAALELQERRATLAASRRERLIRKLKASQAKVEEMRRDMVLVCAWTRQVRDGDEWLSLEQFLERHFQVQVSHGISPSASLATEVAK